MFGWGDLKEKIETEGDEIVCPAKGCNHKVKKMTKKVLHSIDNHLEKNGSLIEEFLPYFCTTHKIYITPTTFIYENFKENLLWRDEEDTNLINEICEYKRVKSQFHHDNSEDAITWNVFRYLEKNNLLPKIFRNICDLEIVNPEIIYWSYSSLQYDEWDWLKEGKKEFGENVKLGSEPDLIIKSDNALFFIEAKITASNETIPGEPYNTKEYLIGGNKWYKEVFRSDFQTVAIIEKKYELLRFWLIGIWIAKQLNLDFYLVNLVLFEREKRIEEIFKPHIREYKNRNFVKMVWEDIYRDIENIEGKRL